MYIALILSMFGGPGLDLPGEGMIIAAIRPVDERPGWLGRDGLVDLVWGAHGEMDGVSGNDPRWGGGRQSGRR